jgi:hypothetical protein
MGSDGKLVELDDNEEVIDLDNLIEGNACCLCSRYLINRFISVSHIRLGPSSHTYLQRLLCFRKI